jgi:hypothetical protein
MRSYEATGTTIEHRFIEGITKGVDVTKLEGTDDGKPPNPVLISLGSSRAARVKIGAHFFDR